MEINETIGIDISKLDFDTRIHSNQKYQTFENSDKGFKSMLNWTYKNSSFLKKEIIFIFEHTGLYSYKMALYLTKKNIPFALVPGLEIKRSLGITRGKDDKIDATKIAKYGYRLKAEITPYRMPSEELNNLKHLLSLRDRLVKQRAGYKASLNEEKKILDNKEYKVLLNTQEDLIKYLTEKIKGIEKKMNALINGDEQLKEMYKLILTIKGVGSLTALYLIVYTNAFMKFKNARKFASYCGIAPFPYSSGTSIRGKTKVNHLANKTIKSLLDLCAKSSIQFNSEMKYFYERRINEGKNKMSTINVVRNKLLARIFAVVKRKTPYIDNMKFAS